MLHYWLSVFIKTFWDSWAFTDRSKEGLFYWLIVFAVTVSFLIRKHGWKSAVSKYWQTSKEGLVIGIIAYGLVLLGHFIYEPFHLQEDEISRTQEVSQQQEKLNFQYLGLVETLKHLDHKLTYLEIKSLPNKE